MTSTLFSLRTFTTSTGLVGHLDRVGVVLADAVRVGPRRTGTFIGGTSAILMVLFSEAKMASERSKPTFLASTSNAVTNLTSRTW